MRVSPFASALSRRAAAAAKPLLSAPRTALPVTTPVRLLSSAPADAFVPGSGAPACAAPAPDAQEGGALLRSRGTLLNGRPMYLDAAATTPVDPRYVHLSPINPLR